jgi:hypothetical protein
MPKMLGSTETRIAVLRQKAKKILSLYKIQLTGLHSFNRQFVRLVHNRGLQAQDFTGLRNA